MTPGLLVPSRDSLPEHEPKGQTANAFQELLLSPMPEGRVHLESCRIRVLGRFPPQAPSSHPRESVSHGCLSCDNARFSQPESCQDNRGLWRIGLQDLEDYIAEAYRRPAAHIASGEPLDDAESGTVE